MDRAPADYKAFRAKLDTVLRTRDAVRLRAFLVAEQQWTADAPIDAEAALWMMVATSKMLADMHDEARTWLMTHGHESEAQAIFGGTRNASTQARPRTSPGPIRPHKQQQPRSPRPRQPGRPPRNVRH